MKNFVKLKKEEYIKKSISIVEGVFPILNDIINKLVCIIYLNGLLRIFYYFSNNSHFTITIVLKVHLFFKGNK